MVTCDGYHQVVTAILVHAVEEALQSVGGLGGEPHSFLTGGSSRNHAWLIFTYLFPCAHYSNERPNYAGLRYFPVL